MIQNENISNKKKLTGALILVLFITITTLSTLYIIFLKNYDKNTHRESEKIYASYLSEEIKNYFDRNKTFTKTLSYSLNISDSTLYNQVLKQKLSRIITENDALVGVSIIAGNIVPAINDKNSFSEDSIGVFKALSCIKDGRKINISENYASSDFLKDIKEKHLNNQDEIILSEPYAIKTNARKVLVQDFSCFIKKGNMLVGFIKTQYDIKKINSFINLKDSIPLDWLLLSPEKNIAASSFHAQDIGKNADRTSGKAFDMYAQYKKKSNPKLISLAPIKGYELLLCPKPKKEHKFSVQIPALILISLLITGIGIFFLLFFLKKTFTPLKNLISKIDRLSKGDNSDDKIQSKNAQIQEVYEKLRRIAKFHREIEDFSVQIIRGNFDTHIAPLSDKDNTSKKLNGIASFLKKKEKENLVREEKTFLQLWTRKGRFEVSEAERNKSKDIKTLGYNIIRAIVNYIDALMGGIYLYDKENEQVELLATYAYGSQKHIKASFKPGEGVVGACIAEKKKVILNKTPEDYIKISTGLGSGTPSYLAVIPIIFKDEINAAIEIAFMKKPEAYKIEFIEQLGDNIGTWLNAALNDMKTKELLEQSKEQALKLAEKEQELNKKVDELQKAQEQTNEINTRLKSILSAVNQLIITVEYTPEGTIRTCNKIFSDVMGYTLEELKGQHISIVAKEQTDDLLQIIESVKKGEIIKKEITRQTKDGKEKKLAATYSPYYDKDGKVSEILFFAFDISSY